MSQRHSERHIWSPSDVLGCGVSGTVFLCRSKETGQKFAAKVLNSEAQKRPHEIRMREAEVLKKLKHPNIVELYSIEEESSLKTMVLVMELCDASLQSILERPSNHFGLGDSQFLVAIGDITAGMSYLRQNDIVHRDVKPGNILGQLQDNGSYRFKLTDFGAARHMDNEDHFTSIYGTEEYLHPDIYEQAVLKKSSGKKFTAAVDLWSLGCTFYQCATGKLPFRPYGKRANRHTMFEMISNKEPSVISGVQAKHGGPIEYSETLPGSSRISAGLRSLVVPIIQGLLRTDSHMSTAFEQYLSRVSFLVNAKIICLFNTSTSTFHTIYTSPDASFADFQDAVTKETDMLTDRQLIFYRDRCISSFKMLPSNTSASSPLILVENSSESEGTLKMRVIPKPLNFAKETKLDMDFAVAKGHAANAFDLQLFATDAHHCCHALDAALSALRFYYVYHVTNQHANHKLWHLSTNSKAMLNRSSRQHNLELQRLIDLSDAVSLNPPISNAETPSNGIDKVSDLVATLEDLKLRLLQIVDDSWQQDVALSDVSDSSREVISAQLSQIVGICNRFDGDRSMNRALTNCDELTHSAEKRSTREAYNKLTKEVEMLIQQKARRFDTFHKRRRMLFDIALQMHDAKAQLIDLLEIRDEALASEQEQLSRSESATVEVLTQRLTVGHFREYDQCPNCEGLDSGLQSLQDMLPDLISLAETEKIMIQHAQSMMVDANGTTTTSPTANAD